MSKEYGFVIHFVDGKTWDKDELDIKFTSDLIKETLDQFQKRDDTEIESMLTHEKRKVSEIKSIELLF